MAKYSKEEKEQFIEEFKNSGLSISSWARKNGLPISTVTRWVSKHDKKSKHSKDVKFIEITMKRRTFLNILSVYWKNKRHCT